MKYIITNNDWKINKEYNINKLLYLLIDRPYKTNSDIMFWINGNDQFHRDYDLPAVININNGYFAWYKNGVLYKPVLRNNK